MHTRRFLASGVVSLSLLSPFVVTGSEPTSSRPPGELQLEALLVAPVAHPHSQLVTLRFEGDAPSNPFRLEVRVDGQAPAEANWWRRDCLPDGRALIVPPLEKETKVTVKATGEDWQREATIKLRPLRPWKLFLVQHTHTDIGYTALPSRLNVDHLGYLDEALRACRLTDDYPDDARFRWTCEATWTVERYVEERPPELVREFLDRVREGRIEVTAMRMNMTDLASEELVVRNLLPVKRLRARGIPIHSAMQCDVNGYPWCLPELLEEIGVTGLAGGINQTRSTLPFEFPRAISWKSPAGASVVGWRGEHYMFANMMGFRDSVTRVLTRLPGYLRLLEKRGYPYRIALLQMAGYFTDNAAPSHRASDLAQEWNEHFATPRVRLACLSEWFEALRHEEPPPVYQKAWPDWWADGVGSAPLETAIIRNTQEKLGFAETFLSLARAVRRDVPDRRSVFRSAHLLSSLYDEHTFGAAESISRPLSINTKSQWKEKSSYSYRARWLANELADSAFAFWAARAVPRGETGIVVFNSLPWKRDAPVVVEVSRGVVDDGAPFRIIDRERDREVPYQFAASFRNYREVEFVAKQVPPVGYRVYRLEVGREPQSSAEAFQVAGSSLSNGRTRVELDSERAGIASIHSPPDAPNAVDAGSEYALGQYVHERIVDEKGRWHLWPMVSYTPDSFKRFTSAGAEVKKGATGPARASLRLVSRIAAPSGEITLDTEVSLYRDLPGVFLRNRLEYPGTTDAEAGYFAFPFAGTNAPRADVPGGVMVPGRDQIPGSAADWHALQRWVRVEGDGQGIAWATIDAPLVQFGDFNTGRWTKGLSLEKPVFYSWVSNNYWFTNFVASQPGEFLFRYAVATSGDGASDGAAHRFARSVCSPLRAVVRDGRGVGRVPSHVSLLGVEPACVDLVGVKEAEDVSRALVVRLRNRSAESTTARVSFSSPLEPVAALVTDILEEPQGELDVKNGSLTVKIRPWRLRTLLVRFE